MKKSMFIRNTLAMLLTIAMVMAMLGSFAFADSSTAAKADTVLTQDQAMQKLDEKGLQELQNLQDQLEEEDGAKSLGHLQGTWVTVRIQGYKDQNGGGVILDEYKVRLTDDTGYTILDALEEACDDNDISVDIVKSQYGSYVNAIGGQEQAYFQPNTSYYSGWMYRVWPDEYQPSQPQEDTLPWDAAGDYVLESGDKVTWYYAIPTFTMYTIMDNYEDINLLTWRGQTLDVNVKGQIYEDIINWNLLPFENLEGATVTLTKASDGTVLASAESDVNGDAALSVPAVGFPTLCYINVDSKYYTSGQIAGGIEQTKSWRKPVIVIW